MPLIFAVSTIEHRNYDDLPLFLNTKMVTQVLGVSLIQRIRVDARARLPGAEGGQTDGRAKGAVHPLGAGAYRRQCLRRAKQPPELQHVSVFVAPVCLDQGRGRVPAPSPGFWKRLGGTVLPTLGWGKQSVWLAASGRQTHLRAEARTHFCPRALRRAQAQSSPAGEHLCDGRAGPVCRFRGWGGARGAVDDISAASGRVWGGGCPDHPNSEEERLRGPRFGPFGGVRFSY